MIKTQTYETIPNRYVVLVQRTRDLLISVNLIDRLLVNV
jgi:hypothetical protein